MCPVTIAASPAIGGSPRHVDADYFYLVGIIKELRKQGHLEAALRLACECMDGTEENVTPDGRGFAPGYFEQGAMIYRKQKRYEDEIRVVNRCLAHLQSGSPWWDILAKRAQRAWEMSGRAGQVPLPEGRPWDPPRWARDPGILLTGFSNEDMEYQYRANNGLPSLTLNKKRWGKKARALLGTLAVAEPLIEVLLNNADRFGVVTPDMEMVRSTFSSALPSGLLAIDHRTGEIVEPSTPVEMWLAVATGFSLSVVSHAINKLSPQYHELIEFWAIANDPMDGHACLTLR